MIHNFDEILSEAGKVDEKVLVVPEPYSRRVLTAVHKTKVEKLIIPVLVGDGRSIEKRLSDLKIDAGGYEIVDEPDSSQALTRAIEMLTHKEADMIFQGGITSKKFLDAIADKESGIATPEALSYVSLYEMRTEDRMVLLTDTFIQEFPDLKKKIIILRNAISLAGTLGMEEPKVAALTMVELVNLARQSTIDAAILSKMSQRKQLDAIVDGPLDIDCASSLERAKRKKLESPVAGKVDIFLFPDIESSYSTVELLAFLGGVKIVGALMGSNNPVILNLRFETTDSILISVALASLRLHKP